MRTRQELDTILLVHGHVSKQDAAAAKHMIETVAAEIDDPILLAKVALIEEPDPARDRPAVAKATLDVNGDLVRAHVAAETMPEAIGLLRHRLHDRLEHRAQHLHALRHRPPEHSPGEWRHGDLPSHRPHTFPRSAEDRRLVRHKSWVASTCTAEEAIWEMELLDHDFHLFVDADSNEDLLVRRVGDGTYELVAFSAVGAQDRIRVAPAPAPTLSLEEALCRLEASGEGSVFFRNRATGRGNVVYARYDGHYGLVTPASMRRSDTKE